MGAVGMCEPGLWHREANAEALDQTLAESVAESLIEAIETRGKASLVVSGGSTPLGFFKRLARKELDWSRVLVTLADERWVRPEHKDSNEGAVRRELMVGPAAEATFVSLFAEGAHPSAALATLTERLSTVGTFDIVILGMGGDGHTASLFPGAETLILGLDRHSGLPLIAVDPPEAMHARVSMTLPRLADARRLVLHITGPAKKAVLERAAVEDDRMRLPIAAFLGATEPAIEVFWAP